MSILKIKKFFIILVLVHLTACTMQPTITPPTQEEQESRWTAFLLKEIEKKPYTLQGSFRFGDSNNTNRVNYILWSNGTVPLRLDIMAGVGTNIAKVEENKKEITMYFPQQKRAIIMDNFDELNPLVSLGMPVPISFYEMSLILRGGLREVLTDIKLEDVIKKQAKLEHQKYTYYFSSKKMVGLLQLDTLGNVVYCEVNDEWSFDIIYDEQNQPDKVVISSLVEDYRAILLVKERSYPVEYNEKDFKFSLPKETEISKS